MSISLFRKEDFLSWLFEYDQILFKELEMSMELGEWPTWLCYLWSHPEKQGYAYTDSSSSRFINEDGVVASEARRYCRTAIKCLIDHKSFDQVEEFEENDSVFPTPSLDDGRLKLATLLGVVVECHKDETILYIGSGDITSEKQYVIDNTATNIEFMDVVKSEGVVQCSLQNVKLDYDVILNDVYDDFMPDYQFRIACVKTYYAKQVKVKESDFYFVLPGLTEPRYTNNILFKDFVRDLLVTYMSNTGSRDSVVMELVRRMFPCFGGLINVLSTDTVAYRREVEKGVVRVGLTLTHLDLAVYLPFLQFSIDTDDGRVSYTKQQAQDFVLCNGLSRDFIDYYRNIKVDYKKYLAFFHLSIRKSEGGDEELARRKADKKQNLDRLAARYPLFLYGQCTQLTVDLIHSHITDDKRVGRLTGLNEYPWLYNLPKYSYQSPHRGEGNFNNFSVPDCFDLFESLLRNKKVLDFSPDDFAYRTSYSTKGVKKLYISSKYATNTELSWNGEEVDIVVFRYSLVFESSLSIFNEFSNKTIIVLDYDTSKYTKELYQLLRIRYKEVVAKKKASINIFGKEMLLALGFRVLGEHYKYNSYCAVRYPSN